MRFLFLGMHSPFTHSVLASLLEQGQSPAGLLLTDQERTRPEEPGLRQLTPPPPQEDPLGLPLLDPFIEPDPLHLAWAQHIPAFAWGPDDLPRVQAFMAQMQPDAAVVACFDRRIPQRLLDAPRHGFLNVHPSRLPHYRGPAPLFWQLRDGVNPVGVTVHWMDAGLDTGDLAAQTWVPLPDGASWPQVEALCGQAGGHLLVQTLTRLAAGRAQRRAQPPGGSYQPAPSAADFALSRAWTAQRAFNFMRGTAAWGRPYALAVGDEVGSARGDEVVLLGEALAWEPHHRGQRKTLVEGPVHDRVRGAQSVWVRFRRGRLLASLAGPRRPGLSG